MRRWGLALALLLSLGVNIGILATLAVRRAAPPDRPRPEEPRPAPPGAGQETEEPPPRAAPAGRPSGPRRGAAPPLPGIQGRFFDETVRLRMSRPRSSASCAASWPRPSPTASGSRS